MCPSIPSWTLPDVPTMDIILTHTYSVQTVETRRLRCFSSPGRSFSVKRRTLSGVQPGPYLDGRYDSAFIAFVDANPNYTLASAAVQAMLGSEVNLSGQLQI